MNSEVIDLKTDAEGAFPPRLSLRARFAGRLRKVQVDTLAIVLITAALASGVATFISMSGWGSRGPDPTATLVLLNVDLLIVLGLTVLVGARLVRLWRAHREGTVGSRLHVRLVLLFGVIAMTPTLLIAIFSTLFFNFGVQTWFGDRVRTAVTESAAIARAYLEEHQQAIKADALAVANDINRQWAQLSGGDPALRDQFLSTQAAFRGLTEAVIFASDLQVIAKAGYTFALQTGEQIPFQAIATANIGQVAVLTGQSSDRVRALVKLESYPAAYLLVGRFVDANVLARLSRTEEAVSEYVRLEGERSELEVSFTMLFAVVALLLLMVSVWFGLALATRLARPIIELISAAERVRGGDLTVRVQEAEAVDDELSYLSRAFNRMTKRLGEQQTALRDTNAQLDERRRFTETVLAGVSAGVIGLDPKGNITLPNRSASVLLGLDLGKHIGRPLAECVPEFSLLLDEARAAPQRIIQQEVQIAEGSSQKTFLARLSVEQVADAVAGYVVTFDDITALQSAQRKAAWADVARRIAHEIKNPLTPIQLSAERLKRKYLDKLSDESGLFAQCTDTIIRHVGDIGHMVDEFSAFARLPSAVLKPADLSAVARDAVMLQRHAYPHISFDIDMPASVRLRCDARQVGQVLTNVLKNAVEAVDARFGPAEPGRKGQGCIVVRIERSAGETAIRVIDNGVGLPQTERERLTEPYVTTRAKGTGLGLAIVKKIMEDHGGAVILEDLPNESGAQVTLRFPQALADDSESQPLRAAGE